MIACTLLLSRPTAFLNDHNERDMFAVFFGLMFWEHSKDLLARTDGTWLLHFNRAFEIDETHTYSLLRPVRSTSLYEL